jgi:hypothetical protein
MVGYGANEPNTERLCHVPIPRSVKSVQIAAATWFRVPVVPPTILPQQSESTTPPVAERPRNVIPFALAKWCNRLCQGEPKPYSSIAEAQPCKAPDLTHKAPQADDFER